MTRTPGPIADERAARLRSRANEGAESPRQFEHALTAFGDASLAEGARRAYQFAEAIPYDHAGLSPASYMAHPARVAIMALAIDPDVTDQTIVLALLHNVFEVSKVTPDEIARRFGPSITNAIAALTVDRTQTSREYTAAYYSRLANGPRFVRVVKILDKLDNLYILGLNPDAEVRQRYLDDIETYVRPMVRLDLPHLSSYFDEVIADAKATGFIASPVP